MANLGNKSLISVPEISTPKGGGAIKGIGETFQPNSFSGTGNYAIPFPITKARGLEPEISINYNSGNGNSSFGMGFSIELDKISLRTELGIPKYEGYDTYLLNGSELVLDTEYSETKDGYIIRKYYPRIQMEFLLIKQYLKEDLSESYWEVVKCKEHNFCFWKNE